VFKLEDELEEDLAFERDEVVDNNNGEVILCKPGAKCVGVEEG
jgi:hypothetical protein